MSDERKEPASTEPLAGVPMVRVLDEDGREVLRGWYAFHEKRQLCPMGYDELRPDDVQHLVIHSGWADWNMPRDLKVSVITPPHRIVPVDRMLPDIVRCRDCRSATPYRNEYICGRLWDEETVPGDGYCHMGKRRDA